MNSFFLRKKRVLGLLFVGLITLIAGCAFPTNRPLAVLEYEGRAQVAKPKNLIIFMRGIGGSHESFEKEGLVAELIEKAPGYDVVAPNAHFGYYLGRSLINRLKEDVIEPAKLKGYEKIWLVGISMGGLGSVLYCTEYPEDIAGVYLIAPVLGYDEVQKEIVAAGGLSQWKAGEYEMDDEWQKGIWHWIQTKLNSAHTPPLYLGFGKSDPYADGQYALADQLDKSRVIAIDGGHDYKTFKSLWTLFLEQNTL
jgi:pimeloyl-ACP methyl ester carboxylesterase